MIIYDVEVQAIGEAVGEMLVEDGVIITFREDVPPELKPYAFLVNHHLVNENVTIGDIVRLGDEEFKITAVGETVNNNLRNLGHLVFRFDAAKKPMLPGAIHLNPTHPPILNIKSKIQIVRNEEQRS